MISRQEIETQAQRFGAPDTQVVRDHLISHVIAALACSQEKVTFFGGTALCRTWLPDLRLSEDIDLLVDNYAIGQTVTKELTHRLRREFPGHEWAEVKSQNQVTTWNLLSDNSSVKVQFVQWRDGWRSMPTTSTQVQLRYGDLPDSVDLTVPTTSGFATMKLLAWFDRHTPRDLFDLAALADASKIDRAAIERVKPIAGFTPSLASLELKVPPSVELAWESELGHQLANTRSPEECLSLLRACLADTGR